MFKRLFAFTLFIIASPLFAKELLSFDEVIEALSAGKNVRVIVHGKQCVVDDPNEHKIPAGNAIIKLGSVLYTEDKIGFDFVKYGRPIPVVAPNGLIQRASLILEKNGKLDMIISSFDPVTNNKIVGRKDITVACQLGYSARLYQD